VAPFRDDLAGHLSREAGGHPRWALHRLAALLHDVGKPATRTVDEATGRLRFLRHELVGAELAAAIGRRLRLGADETAYLATVVRAHLRPLALAGNGAEAGTAPSPRAVLRYFDATDDAGVDVALLALADNAAKPEVDEASFASLSAVVADLLGAWFRESASRVRPAPVISGDVLMRELGLPPGPQIGRLLAALREAQVEGEVSDEAGALALARRLAAGERPLS
jgi:putative nucleotidyltransferase with HDIG domain